jgi:hypothetical protein
MAEISSSTLRIKQKVMSIIGKIKGQPSIEEAPAVADTALTQKEIEFILSTLRDSSFKGSQVVELYNTVLKLQQQYKIQAT